MELALSLGGSNGNPTLKPFSFLENKSSAMGIGDDLGFCMGLVKSNNSDGLSSRLPENMNTGAGIEDPSPVQLDLLPLSPVHRHQSGSQLRFPWLSDNRKFDFFFFSC